MLIALAYYFNVQWNILWFKFYIPFVLGPIPVKPQIVDKGNNIFDVAYVPPPENSKCDVKVTYGGKDIPGR